MPFRNCFFSSPLDSQYTLYNLSTDVRLEKSPINVEFLALQTRSIKPFCVPVAKQTPTWWFIKLLCTAECNQQKGTQQCAYHTFRHANVQQCFYVSCQEYRWRKKAHTKYISFRHSLGLYKCRTGKAQLVRPKGKIIICFVRHSKTILIQLYRKHCADLFRFSIFVTLILQLYVEVPSAVMVFRIINLIFKCHFFTNQKWNTAAIVKENVPRGCCRNALPHKTQETGTTKPYTSIRW